MPCADPERHRLPAVLFTAMYVKPTREMITELERLQKQFLWHSSTSSEPSRHNINSSLLFTPVKAGGLGMMSIQVAMKEQAIKRATTWLLTPPDEYTEVWHFLVHPNKGQSTSCCHLSPLR